MPPSVGILLSFIIGLCLGNIFPTQAYLFLAIPVVGLGFRLSRINHPKAMDITLLSCFILIGAARMSFVHQSPRGENFILRHSAQWTQAAKDQLEQRLLGANLSDDELHLTEALLWGKRAELSPGIKKRFRDVGASHLLALSGMHLGILYSLLYCLFIRWTRFTWLRWIVFPLFIALIWGYTILCGCQASLVRASTMLTLHCLRQMHYLSTSSMQIYAFSLFVILAVSPTMLTDVGFQLSCMAVLTIVLLFTPLSQVFKGLPSLLRWASGVLFISICAQIGTAPLAAYYFHTLPLLAAPMSLLLIPITTCIIYLGLLALLFPTASLGSAIKELVNWELWLMDKGVELCPRLVITDIYISPWQTFLLCAFVLVSSLYIHQRAKFIHHRALSRKMEW